MKNGPKMAEKILLKGNIQRSISIPDKSTFKSKIFEIQIVIDSCH